MIYRLGKQTPDIHSTVFVAKSADIIGQVTLKEHSSVWFNAVIRGDCAHIEVGARSNIQDGAVLHADPGTPCIIGADVTVGHNAMVHGCTIGEGSLVGINAVVLDGAVVGKNCLIGAGALVTGGTQIPDNSLVLGAPAKVKATLTEEQITAMRGGAKHYVRNAALFAAQLVEQPDDE